jgi:DNA-binding NarL/FixJ family response regulator
MVGDGTFSGCKNQRVLIEHESMNLHPPRILSIGQCQIDGPRMKRVLEQNLGAVVEDADSASEAVDKARQHRYHLILVNRELAGDNSSGLDVAAQLIALHPQTPVMIVSDFESAQAAAVRRGALRGFGKSELEQTETLRRLAQIVRSAPT